jgi:segregation and condensation protein B
MKEQLLDSVEFENTELDSIEEDSDGVDSNFACPISARISALLFVSTKPLSIDALSQAAGVKPETVERELGKLIDLFSLEVHGFSLQCVAGGLWQFRTNPGAASSIHRLIPKSVRRLSRAAAETLAVIAYRQPVQRAEIETIRGVDALPTIKTLLDAKLIRVIGRGEAVGQPALYGTTEEFLEKFGLNDLSQLPTPREIAELMQEPGDVEDSEEDLLVEEIALERAESSASS